MLLQHLLILDVILSLDPEVTRISCRGSTQLSWCSVWGEHASLSSSSNKELLSCSNCTQLASRPYIKKNGVYFVDRFQQVLAARIADCNLFRHSTPRSMTILLSFLCNYRQELEISRYCNEVISLTFSKFCYGLPRAHCFVDGKE